MIDPFQTSSDTDTIAPAQDPAGSTKRILVVDDDRDTRQLCVDILAGARYRVDTATDGEAAWDSMVPIRYDSDGYDLVITDNNMPKLSGIDLVRKMRAARLALPVILISGQFPAIIDQAISSGTPIEEQEWNRRLQIAAALLKPFTVPDLLRTVKVVLRQTASDDCSRSISSRSRLSMQSPTEYGAFLVSAESHQVKFQPAGREP
jgi:two-component system alkaline phosphatase synthesis response regulator PhoP